MWAQKLIAPQRFVLCEVEAPSPDLLGEGQVLLESLAGGICGSDLPFYRGATSQPGTATAEGFGRPGFPMHEIAGRVLASRHPSHRPGDTVVGWASGFDAIAEQVVSDGEGLASYSPELSPEVAILLQPLACVLFAVEQLPDLSRAHVAVLGLGPIGLLFCHVLKEVGAARVTGIDRVDRSSLGGTFRVDDVVHASADRWAADLLPSERPEVVIEAIGHQGATVNNSIHAVADGGWIFCFGVPDDSSYAIDLRTLLRKNLTLRAGVTQDRRRMLAAATAYLQAFPELATFYVTNVISAQSVGDAFDLACRPQSGQVKVAVTMK